MLNISALSSRMSDVALSEPKSGVSFANKQLKINTVEDAKEVVDAINACENLEYLDLQGNSIGIVGAQEIGKALEKHGELQYAYWNDMFTGRLKTEIPNALGALGKGLIKANAHLKVLNLFDNASGPIGIEGITELITSPVCYSLSQLNLNNMGIGIEGGKMLAAALTKCYEKSKEAGTPLALKEFQAGRNRLENEGATALAGFFKKLGSLELIHLYQNGIYPKGIKALSEAFSVNPNLRSIDLTDNTIKFEGSCALASAFEKLDRLEVLSLGDSLIKTKGAMELAIVLEKKPYPNLQRVSLHWNNLKVAGCLVIAQAIREKPNLQFLSLNGNQMSKEDIAKITLIMDEVGKKHVLESFSDDEGDIDTSEEGEHVESTDSEDDDEDSDDDDDDDDGDKQDSSEYEEETVPQDSRLNGISPMARLAQQTKAHQVSAAGFLTDSSESNFIGLGPNPASVIIDEVKTKPFCDQFDCLLDAIMRVSSLIVSKRSELKAPAISCTESLYEQLFTWARERQASTLVNNNLPVFLGLIKSEGKKKGSLPYNQEGCLIGVRTAMERPFFSKDASLIVEMIMKLKI